MSDDRASPGGEDEDEDLPWDARIRRLVDFGVDETLIEENLRRTPTERLQRMMEMVRFIEENRTGRRS
jgi:hypothetical protein